MGFSALRHQFGKHVGEEFAEKRPSVLVSASVLSKTFSPVQQSVNGVSPEVEQGHEQSL